MRIMEQHVFVKLRHQCCWCGYDRREGEHGIQQDRPQGDGVNVFCKVLVQVHYPARVFVLEASSDAQ